MHMMCITCLIDSSPLPHNRYVMSRLMSLCELYISKHVERATKDSIAKANVDIIGEVQSCMHVLKWWSWNCVFMWPWVGTCQTKITPTHTQHPLHTHTHTHSPHTHTQDSCSPHSCTMRLSSALGASTSSQAITLILRKMNNSCNWTKTTSLMWRSIDGHLTRPLWTSIRPSTSILRGRSQVGVVYSQTAWRSIMKNTGEYQSKSSHAGRC